MHIIIDLASLDICGKEPKVREDHICRISVLLQTTSCQQECPGAEIGDDGQIMTDKEHGTPFRRKISHLCDAFFLETGITNSQHFVDYQDLRFEKCRHCKCKTDVHSTRIPLHRCVEKLFHLGKRHDIIELRVNLIPLHPENRAR